jgi:hypothetical protein
VLVVAWATAGPAMAACQGIHPACPADTLENCCYRCPSEPATGVASANAWQRDCIAQMLVRGQRCWYPVYCEGTGAALALTGFSAAWALLTTLLAWRCTPALHTVVSQHSNQRPMQAPVPTAYLSVARDAAVAGPPSHLDRRKRRCWRGSRSCLAGPSSISGAARYRISHPSSSNRKRRLVASNGVPPALLWGRRLRQRRGRGRLWWRAGLAASTLTTRQS